MIAVYFIRQYFRPLTHILDIIFCNITSSEQQIGNFQNVQQVLEAKSERSKFGRFFYRFPSGEAGLDVYSRVSSFIPTLVRDCNQYRMTGHDVNNMNIGETNTNALYSLQFLITGFLCRFFLKSL
jgi:hypothetical protein